MPDLSMTKETQLVLAVIALFAVPRVLQRFRIPAALSALGLGAVLGIGFHAFHEGATVPLLASFGIVSLFLYAGLEVDPHELRRCRTLIAQHLGVQAALLVAVTFAARALFALDARAAVLFALALLTPSTGFILDSLGGFGLSIEHRSHVRALAIASEIVALAVLFFTVKSSHAPSLGLSAAALVAMVVGLPVVFRVFGERILPHAPRSEFSFLVVTAVVCAYITRELGVYYLVGAFVVGVTAVRMREALPALGAAHTLEAIASFASFFIPFYFFKAGLHLQASDFSPRAVGLGLAFSAVIVPLKVVTVALHRRATLREPVREGARVGLTLVPTLVFTIVIADILRERYALPAHLYGALMVFTLTNTLVPGFALRPSTASASSAVPRASSPPAVAQPSP